MKYYVTAIRLHAGVVEGDNIVDEATAIAKAEEDGLDPDDTLTDYRASLVTDGMIGAYDAVPKLGSSPNFTDERKDAILELLKEKFGASEVFLAAFGAILDDLRDFEKSDRQISGLAE
jgi:hypothetical protein